MNSLLSFWFRSIIIPKSVIKKLTSLTTHLFYHSGENKKLYITSWYKTTLHKEKGGSGLIDINNHNVIWKIKLLRKIIRHSSIYAKWCKQKYGSPWDPKKIKASSLWKDIISLANKFKNYFQICDNRVSTFVLWNDNS